MTATNVNPIAQAVSTFNRLDVDDQLAVLGLLYADIANQIPANVIDFLPTEKAANLVAQIQQFSPEEQLYALRDILPSTRNDQDEVMLDPHPSKAMVELSRGGTTIPTGEYGSMNTEAKLAFWYLLAERLGTTLIAIPQDYHLSESAIEVGNFLKSLNTNDLVSFMKGVL
ncbi:Orange carotenoid-binding protein [Anabaena sphaerica FACHB-251]|uniref:Orange carotenoid-binding protein n=1 Tax=Anabaena sphaerica FACHB-251 TaxID=2692883 RepID=A0A927A3E9_9NOST|nr:orange carotenoid protein N-terminal domain-containing protein [Anabaena sphaerica]MBD2296644.1 Orange carotenoid-binding protein [Anabaena sphaerica FACHB-251]